MKNRIKLNCITRICEPNIIIVLSNSTVFKFIDLLISLVQGIN